VLASPLVWVLLAVVVVATLAIGSVHGAPASRSARISYLESVIKCPVCEDVSIAGSNAQQAANLRAKVVSLVDAGKTNAQVEQYVVGQFGTDELLRPRNALLWILPVAAGVIAVGALGSFFVRRGRQSADATARDEDEALVAAALDRKAAP
jgi:cytochrome c-type biogenesis protein CcmH